MTRTSQHLSEITPEVLLKAYACGIFPMAESADDPSLYWVDPAQRGVIPLDSFHVSKRLARTVRSDRFEVYADRDFNAVIDACAAPARGRRKTWINERIRKLYRELFQRGYCHTIETWRGGKLVGGLYGLALGGAFFGESMFHLERDASKVALVHLVGRLKRGGFKMLDTQFITEHLASFGAVEIERDRYHGLLAEALEGEGDFYCLPPDCATAGGVVLQSVIQTS